MVMNINFTKNFEYAILEVLNKYTDEVYNNVVRSSKVV